jgi:hypothetical protein
VLDRRPRCPRRLLSASFAAVQDGGEPAADLGLGDGAKRSRSKPATTSRSNLWYSPPGQLVVAGGVGQ